MENQEIKDKLLELFKEEFTIEEHFDSDESESQSFEKQVGFEYEEKNGTSHDVWMDVCGSIFVKNGDVSFHDPIGYGPSENQSDGSSISDWEFNEVQVFIDGGCEAIITINELHDFLFPN